VDTNPGAPGLTLEERAAAALYPYHGSTFPCGCDGCVSTRGRIVQALQAVAAPAPVVTERVLAPGVAVKLPPDHFLAHASEQEWLALTETAFVCEACGDLIMLVAFSPAAAEEPSGPPCVHVMPTIKAAAKVGRNDPCPCGSGGKWKKCCGRATP